MALPKDPAFGKSPVAISSDAVRSSGVVKQIGCIPVLDFQGCGGNKSNSVICLCKNKLKGEED